MSAGTTTWPFWCDGAQLFADRSPETGLVDALVGTGVRGSSPSNHDDPVPWARVIGVAVVALSPVIIARRASVSDKKVLT
jgi:hypothetical protein